MFEMKLKEGFFLRQVAGQHVVLPMSGDLDMDIMIKLNGSGAFLWEKLQQETDADALTAALLKEYDVDEATARECVAAFIAKLSKNGFLE